MKSKMMVVGILSLTALSSAAFATETECRIRRVAEHRFLFQHVNDRWRVVEGAETEAQCAEAAREQLRTFIPCRVPRRSGIRTDMCRTDRVDYRFTQGDRVIAVTLR